MRTFLLDRSAIVNLATESTRSQVQVRISKLYKIIGCMISLLAADAEDRIAEIPYHMSAISMQYFN